ncbi:MAG: HAD-IIB family hydrolase [Ramlibacter sp.]|nr:HAD-IIB family hydrolase [Ramlibacter sp.]
MIPIAEIGAGAAAAIHTLITDVDDTVTTDGVLTASAYAALEQLRGAGLRVIVTTGRPAGWCDHIARMWPVDAVIGENGAVCFWYDRAKRRLATRHSLSGERLHAHRDRIQEVAEEVLRSVPGTALASDQFCRLYDLAIDYCEDVPRVGDEGVDSIVRIMEDAGMTAKVSSIHVNGWFGGYDKLSMSKDVMRDLFGIDLDRDRARFIYAGDSPNDAPMFGHFPFSVGVANVRDYAGRMDALPKYVTAARSGEGFSELASVLIAMRRRADA